MWNPFSHHKRSVIGSVNLLLQKLQENDPATIAALQRIGQTAPGPETESLRQEAITHLTASLAAAEAESHSGDNHFESRDPLVGLLQSSLNSSLKSNPDDSLPAWTEKYGTGDLEGWIPTGILAVLDFLRPKAEFRWDANPDSFTYRLPEKCVVFLIADWGADNEPAARIRDLIKAKAELLHDPVFVIHLGDIYYSGTEPECRTFLKNWPLRDSATGKPLKDYSFALNGNHEMYSGGRAYMSIVLPAFNQPASYFQLRNQHWRIVGLDTAYVPFRLLDDAQDVRIRPQWDWLVANINQNPQPKNIFLSHHQPFSAYSAEQGASAALRENIDQLTGTSKQVGAVQPSSIFAWFFGHEHRCTIYDDERLTFKARLIGNGCIPHEVQTATTPQALPNGELCMKFKNLVYDPLPGGNDAKSGFVQLTVNASQMQVDYTNEDGTQFFSETW